MVTSKHSLTNGRRFAVFDIDGTLIRWQLYHAVVNQLAKKGFIDSTDYTMIKNARMEWKNRAHEHAYNTYEELLVTAIEKVLRSIPARTFDKAVEEVTEEYKNQTYTYTRQLIGKLKSEGFFLLAISGSYQEVISVMASHYGFDDYLGTEYKRSGGKFTGEVLFPASDKQAALQSLIDKHDLILKGSIAVGDSSSDISMLSMVDNPIAFNPEQKLYEVAIKSKWKIVIERKNVIYRLEHKDDQYILA